AHADPTGRVLYRPRPQPGPDLPPPLAGRRRRRGPEHSAAGGPVAGRGGNARRRYPPHDRAGVLRRRPPEKAVRAHLVLRGRGGRSDSRAGEPQAGNPASGPLAASSGAVTSWRDTAVVRALAVGTPTAATAAGRLPSRGAGRTSRRTAPRP